jgi:hypothetical protein
MAMTDEMLYQRARAYASQRDIQLRRQLGLGTHGAVFAAESKLKPLRSAIKIYKERDPYDRERSVYQRLAEHEVSEIEGFHRLFHEVPLGLGMLAGAGYLAIVFQIKLIGRSYSAAQI